MEIKIDKKTLKNIFFCVAGLIVLYWFLHAGERVSGIFSVVKGILSPFVMGAAFAFVINVPMRAVEGKLKRVENVTLRRCIALLITFILLLIILAGVFLLLIPQLTETIQSLIPKLRDFFIKVEKLVVAFLNDNPELLKWIQNNTGLQNLDIAGLAQKALTVVGNSVSTILGSAFSAIGSVTSAVMDLFIAVIFSIYCLFQKETLARQGRKLAYAYLPEKFCDSAVRVLRLSNSTFSNFLSGQCVEVCILGCLFAVAMAIFGMPYIPLVSVLVAVTAFIPVVGAWVGCIFGAFFILVANPMQAVWFVIMFVVLQQIENNLIYPRVVGSSIGLSGMWVLVAVAVGGELMGVAGMFLMIPVASVIYTLLQEKTNAKLQGRDIDPEKLKEQPPELRSKFKEKRDATKEKRAMKKKKSKKS